MYTQSWKDLQQKARCNRFYSNGNLVRTWMMSYQEIQKHNPAAAMLLLLLACYDNQDIWYDLIRQGLRNRHSPSWLLEVATREIEFSHAMQALLGFSLIQAKPALNSYSLHPVVQDWCLGYIQGEDVEDEMKVVAMTSIGYSVPTSNEPQYWILQRRLLPHADRMFQMVRDMESCSTHPIILVAVNNLGILYCDQGKLQEAEEMCRRALAGREKVSGEDHASTLDTVHNFGRLYQTQGKLQEAEDMYQRALAGREKALGPDHTWTLMTVNRLGLLYQAQGKLQKAEIMYQRALAGKKKNLGEDHTSTLDTVHNFGHLYQAQGKLRDAEAMYKRALAGMEKALGPDHTSTLNSVHCLGILYADEGKLQDAEVMYKRALAGYEKALGPDHTSTLRVTASLHNLISKGVSFILSSLIHFLELIL